MYGCMCVCRCECVHTNISRKPIWGLGGEASQNSMIIQIMIITQGVYDVWHQPKDHRGSATAKKTRSSSETRPNHSVKMGTHNTNIPIVPQGGQL